MDFSILDLINRLDPLAITFSLMGGILLLYLPLFKTTHIIMFLLCVSAGFAGTFLPVLDTIATLLRWLSISLLFLWGILHLRVKVSWGIALLWGYVLLGFIFMFHAVSLEWQIQRGILLLLVSVSLPLAYSNASYPSLRLSIISVSVAGAFFSIINFLPLPGHLSEPVRFAGYCKNAGLLVEFLGGFLPFIFWGLWRAGHIAIKILCASGFFLGLITLFFSGQRTGTIGGLISIFPLLFLMLKEKRIHLLFWVLLFPIGLGLLLFQQSSFGKLEFLADRYSFGYGLSGRQAIWNQSFSALDSNPLIGRGIGAAENIISFSFHNAYLEIWFNTGLLGLICFLGAQFYFIFRIGVLGRRTQDPDVLSVLALSLGYMMGFIFMSIFESIGAGASNLNIILYLFLGILVSNHQLLNYSNLSKL